MLVLQANVSVLSTELETVSKMLIILMPLLFSNPIMFVVTTILLLLSFSTHEWAHAFTADRLGDPTPRAQGRVTLNPLKHLDPVGTILLLIVGFGWGKPVMFDPYNLKNPHRDTMFIALAGPLSNMIIAVVLGILCRFGFEDLIIVVQFNVMLALFNLLPIAPLDGFKIVSGLLKEQQRNEWLGLERLGPFFLLALILPLFNGQSMISLWLSPVIVQVTTLLTGMGNIL